MKKLMIATAAAAAASMTLAAAPASAERPYGSYEQTGYHDYNYGRAGYDRHYDRGYNEYDNYGRYREPRRIGRNDRVWRGNDGRYYCRRDNGTTGLIVGAAGGALLGRAIDTHGERATGTILGAVLGGLLGKSIDQSDARCR
ncbi:MAG: glycine zipper 2TM domain-containing protein [Novosphingobium sp.]|nr:glycine zipper 2TM domain-containing protein [Novosphingobium sp.]